MAATATKIAGPTAIGPGLKQAFYTVLLDSSYPTGGEAIDLTADFTYVYGFTFCGNDTSADNGYLYQGLLPAVTTAATSSNTLIQAFWGTAEDDEAFREVANTTDLSSVGTLRLLVTGV